MKTILAFGDSLTWGADPASGGRHPIDDQWPVALDATLGAGYRVIAEGLNGRTTCYDDHSGPCDRNGTRALPVCLASHSPLDLVVIMLGTNDLKPALCGVTEGAVAGMRRLVQIVRSFPYSQPWPVPQVLIVAPPLLLTGPAGPLTSELSVDQSKLFAPAYAALAGELATRFFDAGQVCEASPVDGVHLEAGATRALGEALAPVCASILSEAT